MSQNQNPNVKTVSVDIGKIQDMGNQGMSWIKRYGLYVLYIINILCVLYCLYLWLFNDNPFKMIGIGYTVGFMTWLNVNISGLVYLSSRK